MEVDFRKYHDLESYLLDEIGPRLADSGVLSVEEFFCIIIWKSNRSKSKEAARLSRIATARNLGGGLAGAVKAICSELTQATSREDKFRVLFEGWEFRPPIGSAILAILYPEDFTIYDYRVCEVLDDYKRIQGIYRFDRFWVEYERYFKAVKEAVPQHASMREKDRWLWGKSFAMQLEEEAARGFPGPQER